MSENETGSTLQLAQELIKHLPPKMEAMGNQLKSIISRAEGGHDPIIEIEIIDLLASHEVTRRLMGGQRNLSSGQEDMTLGEAPFTSTPSYGGAILAGNPSLVPYSQKWVCPKDPREPWLLVIQEGEDPPFCEQHKIEMVRGNAGKENRHAR